MDPSARTCIEVRSQFPLIRRKEQKVSVISD
jgi:hypothetical protein